MKYGRYLQVWHTKPYFSSFFICLPFFVILEDNFDFPTKKKGQKEVKGQKVDT